jgi:hypothetical protein
MFATAAAAVFLLLAAGCGSDADRLTSVRGKVSYKGVPLPGGTIVFTPDAARGNSGPLARAEIRPDGTYLLRTGDRPGAVPGWHRVTVAAVEAPGTAPALQRYTVPRTLLPERYRDPEMSGLACEVKPDRVNTLDLNLE